MKNFRSLHADLSILAAIARLLHVRSQFNRNKRGTVMKATSIVAREQNPNSDLTQVIEPLASYICAADRPREALLAALSVLFDEVSGTHKASLMHVACQRANSLGLAC